MMAVIAIFVLSSRWVAPSGETKVSLHQVRSRPSIISFPARLHNIDCQTIRGAPPRGLMRFTGSMAHTERLTTKASTEINTICGRSLFQKNPQAG